MTLESYNCGWAFTFLLCFKLFPGAWGDCPSPPNIPNTSAVAETSGTTGQEIVYTCDRNTDYYEIPGKSTTITCQADGTWTDIEVFCTRGCGIPPRLSEALPTEDALNQNIYLPGAIVTYNCRPGYVRIPGPKRSITCLEDYTWSTPDPFCQRRSCGNPGEIENGEMEIEDFLFGSRVTYTCNTGYRMISRRNYRDCQADGKWSNAPPQCDVTICEAPNVPSDITRDPEKDEYNYLDSVTFSCKKPLEIAGDASIHCRGNGTWSSDVPTCKVVNCPDPDVPNSIRESGFVGPYGLKSAITFKCKKDFVLKGSSTITCNIDSQWEPVIPECKQVSCGDPGTLANGQITYQSVLLGATATYTCNKGYVLIPLVKHRTCQQDETWSSSAPFCEAICEENPTTPSFASRLEASPKSEMYYFNGTVVRFICKPGYDQSTNKESTITCRGHSWSEPDEFCMRKSCGDPGKIQNGHVLVPDYLFGSRATYTCEEGYERNTTREYRECQADGKWSGAIACTEQKPKPSPLGVGAIIGIIIAVVACTAGCLYLLYRCCSQKQKRGVYYCDVKADKFAAVCVEPEL